jgi:serpin B
MLPRWSSTTNLNLSAWLSDRGAAPGAYPGIGPDVGLEHVVHGADIEVNEWGTVAAAATGMSFLMSGSRPPDISIKANRPFLYLIRHRPSGLVLFAGQVTQPAQSNGYTATTRPIHLTGDAPPA